MERARVNRKPAAGGYWAAVRAVLIAALLGLPAWGALADGPGVGKGEKPSSEVAEKGTGEAKPPSAPPAEKGSGEAKKPSAAASEKSPGGAEKPLAAATGTKTGEAADSRAPPTLEQMRQTMSKWVEIRQVISKEHRDWQEGKEMLQSRITLVRNETVALREKINQAESGTAETERKRDELLAENDRLKAAGANLAEVATAMEGEIRRLYKMLPEPVQTQIQPLYQRMPEDPTRTRISVAERFQNVLGILNELNKANNEIAVKVEVHNLADGKPAEVQVIYVGLGQAYYLSASGDGGVGRPAADGWKWEPSSKAVARNILTALEIFQGKQTAAFVPLPVKLQ